MIQKIVNQFKIRKLIYIPVIITILIGYIIAGLSSDIEVYHVYKILPVFVIYTDNINGGDEGRIKGPLIFIRKRSKGNEIILRHELIHSKQSYRYFCFHWVPMLFSDRMLAKMESEAYSIEIKRKEDIPNWALFIKEEYNLSLTQEEIESYILYYWKN